jgi:murein DD-endopeptidase MepM/ murein hydrolase activator NlpD
MIFLERLRKFKNYSILLIPAVGSTGSQYKLTPVRVLIAAVLFAVVIFVISGLLLAYTPLHDVFFTKSNLSSADLENIQDLKEKMIFLTRELESLKSTNERLKYAIMLGDSSVINDGPDSIKKENDVSKKTGGNLLAVLADLFYGEKKASIQQKSPEENGKLKTETLYYFNRPVNGFISRGFYPEKGHFGIDYVLKTGTPVYAAAGGYVVFSDYTIKDGYMVIINHYDNYVTIYKHCSSLVKQVREMVYQGDLIALSGNTGEESIGPHLHFELWKDGQPVNPEKYLLNK